MTPTNNLGTDQTSNWNMRTDAQAYGQALLLQYESAHGCVCPAVRIQLTGRTAKRRLGYYNIPTRSIFVNDAGMSDYGIRSTLVHELAHHVQHTCPLREGNTTKAEPGRSHGEVFRVQHARLRALAVAKGFLLSLEAIDEPLGDIVVRIHGLRRTSGEAILSIGRELVRARERCRLIGESFEVFLEDHVGFDRTTAYDYIRAYEMCMPPKLLFTTMRFLMRIKDIAIRQRAIADALRRVPLLILRLRYARPDNGKSEQGAIFNLLKEKTRLQRRLAQIDAQLRKLQSEKKQKAARDAGPSNVG